MPPFWPHGSHPLPHRISDTLSSLCPALCQEIPLAGWVLWACAKARGVYAMVYN
jgi:hypothetical protein